MTSQTKATYFEHFDGHLPATREHKTKITIANFVLGWNEISTCCKNAYR